MKVIISGGLGYVGGRLSKYLAEEGHTVVALSRQAKNLPLIHLPSGISIHHPDVFIENPGKLTGFDSFVHLAALNEYDCVKFPEKAIEVNIAQTLQWLERTHQAGINRFIYFSTAHVYGKPLEGYYDEFSLTQPVHPYAITHKCAEDYVLSYRTEKDMNNFVVRLTNSFGGPAFPTADRWTLLVNDLCKSAVETGIMTLQSDGTQLRDFITLEDVCRATAHLLDTECESGVFNLGSGNSTSILEMAKRVQHRAELYLHKPVSLSRKQPPQIAPTDQLTISIARLLNTGFSLTEQIDSEIDATLHYFSAR